MIIGINGYIGSGKDTVGKIIQELTKPQPKIRGREEGYVLSMSTWEIKKYAAKLKQIASIMTGIPVEKFEDQEFKKTKMHPMWGDITVREFLQKLGTEAVRDNIHVNAWVNALMVDYDLRPETYTGSGENKWIITDCRFPNEAQAIKDRGGVVIRVDRLKLETLPEEAGFGKVEYIPFPCERHPSETSLDNWSFDYLLSNNGTIEELTSQVKDMLEHFNLTD